MGLQNNSISHFNFLSLLGTVIPPVQTVEIDQRPAVDGVEITRDGTKGKPFQLMSRVDCQTYEQCLYGFDQYTSLIGANPVSLTQGGVSSDARGFKVVVLNVQIVRAVALSGGVGGLSGSQPRGLLECRWDLISKSNTES